jgi:hypothetical protein
MIIVGDYFMNLSPIFQDIILFSTSILKMLSREYRMIGSQKMGLKFSYKVCLCSLHRIRLYVILHAPQFSHFGQHLSFFR